MKVTAVLNKKARISGPVISMRLPRRGSAPFAFVRNTLGHLLGGLVVISHIALTFRPESTLMFSDVINTWRHKQPQGKEALVFADRAPSSLNLADLSRLIWDFTYD